MPEDQKNESLKVLVYLIVVFIVIVAVVWIMYAFMASSGGSCGSSNSSSEESHDSKDCVSPGYAQYRASIMSKENSCLTPSPHECEHKDYSSFLEKEDQQRDNLQSLREKLRKKANK